MVSLRPSLPEDQSGLRELLNMVWNGDQGAVAYHGGGRVQGMVAVEDGQLIGYASARHKTLHPTHTYISAHVHPARRGQGVGAALWREVTANLSGSLKTALYDGDSSSWQFLERRGLRVSVETHQPTLELAQLDLAMLERWKAEAQTLGYELLPMTALNRPDEWRDVARLHAEVYTHSHRHDPPDPAVLEGVDFLDDDLNPDWL